MLNPCEDVAEIQKLVAQALIEIQNKDEDATYPASSTLRYCGSRAVFEVAQGLCSSLEPLERELGYRILNVFGYWIEGEGSLLGTFKPVFTEEILQIYLSHLPVEENLSALQSLIFGLYNLDDESIVEPLLPFAKHPHENIRYAVAIALGGAEDERAITALIELCQDSDEDVRDWATFGLGTQLRDDDFNPIDTPAIREALYRNINDPHPDTRYEALTGLAYRRDKRILTQLIDLLASDEIHIDSDYGYGFCECLEHYQAEIDDPRLSEILRVYHESKKERDSDSH